MVVSMNNECVSHSQYQVYVKSYVTSQSCILLFHFSYYDFIQIPI